MTDTFLSPIGVFMYCIVLSELFKSAACMLKNDRKLMLTTNVFDGDEEEQLDASIVHNLLRQSQFLEEEIPVNYTFVDPLTPDELQWTISAAKLIGMLDAKKYSRLQTPGQPKGETTTVKVSLYVESMSTFRAQSMDFELDMYLTIAWFDHRLMHNSTHPILVTDSILAELMWHPDLYFVNSKFSYMHRVTTPNFMVLVYPDGFVMKSMRIDVTLACMLHLHNFPMDEQSCSINIQSYAFIENVLRLDWVDSQLPIQFKENIKINDMDMTAVVNERCDYNYPLFRGVGRWSCLKGIITMKRKVQFHIFQVFVPSGMLVVISWLSFWLDIRATPARIALTITALLTLTTMSNGSRQDMPHVPYMKANDVWFAVCQAFVFGVLLEYTIVNVFLGYANLASKSAMHSKSLNNIIETNVDEYIAQQNSKKKSSAEFEKYAHKVDQISKFVFPISFSLFIIVYWSYYVS